MIFGIILKHVNDRIVTSLADRRSVTLRAASTCVSSAGSFSFPSLLVRSFVRVTLVSFARIVRYAGHVTAAQSYKVRYISVVFPYFCSIVDNVDRLAIVAREKAYVSCSNRKVRVRNTAHRPNFTPFRAIGAVDRRDS